MNQLTTDLRAARAYLVEHGWCQNESMNDKGQVCIDGAMQYSIGDTCSDVTGARYAATADSVYHALNYVGGYINWNDQEGRTQDEVLALFDRAIAAAEQA